jgi:hypothetical protein
MTPQPLATESAGEQTEGRTVPLSILLMGVVVLAIGLFIGTQVIGVLFALIAPPPPPTPPNLTQVEHKSADYGSDEWLYTSTQHPCDVAQHYIQSGGSCEFAPQWCGPGSGTTPNSFARITPGDHVARCLGTSNFSIFAQRWQILIASAGYSGAEGTTFRVVRDVLWNGQASPLVDPAATLPATIP